MSNETVAVTLHGGSFEGQVRAVTAEGGSPVRHVVVENRADSSRPANFWCRDEPDENGRWHADLLYGNNLPAGWPSELHASQGD